MGTASRDRILKRGLQQEWPRSSCTPNDAIALRCDCVTSYLRVLKVGYEMVVDGIAQIQALKLTFQGLKFPVISLVLLVRRRIPQKFQALKFQNSGPEIWRIHPPPFHTPPFACLLSPDGGGKNRSDCFLLVPNVSYPTPPPQILVISECDGKSLAIAILLRFLKTKAFPLRGLAGEGYVCDRRSR